MQAAPAVPMAPEPVLAGAPPAVAPIGAVSPVPVPAATALAADARAKKGPRELDTICGSPTSDCKHFARRVRARPMPVRGAAIAGSVV